MRQTAGTLRVVVIAVAASSVHVCAQVWRAEGFVLQAAKQRARQLPATCLSHSKGTAALLIRSEFSRLAGLPDSELCDCVLLRINAIGASDFWWR